MLGHEYPLDVSACEGGVVRAPLWVDKSQCSETQHFSSQVAVSQALGELLLHKCPGFLVANALFWVSVKAFQNKEHLLGYV